MLPQPPQLLTHEALLDTAADITLMLSLFYNLKKIIQKSEKDLKLQNCAFGGPTLCSFRNHLAAMTVVHPVYVLPLNAISFLIGKDLLYQFDAFIDFKCAKIWAQVCQPLPISIPQDRESQCHVLETGEITVSVTVQCEQPNQTGPILGDSSPNSESEALWPSSELQANQETSLCAKDASSDGTQHSW